MILDLPLRTLCILNFHEGAAKSILENAVDFVTQKEGVLTYYQVTADMTAEETFEREMRPLRSIQDNYEKIVLTLDRFSLGNYDGIKVVNVIDWLLG